MDQLLEQYPQLRKYLALVGLGYLALSILCNLLALVVKSFGLQGTRFGTFVGHLLELVANLPGLMLRFRAPDPNGPIVRGLLVIAAASMFFLASTARAQQFKVGPSCPLLRIGLGARPLELAPGLGVQGGLDFGKWNIDAALFGSLTQGAATDGRASFAFFGCYSPLGACLGPVVDVATSGSGGLFSGFTWKQNFGLVANISWDALAQLHYKTTPAAPAGGQP